jgi:hypothetical protein
VVRRGPGGNCSRPDRLGGCAHPDEHIEYLTDRSLRTTLLCRSGAVRSGGGCGAVFVFTNVVRVGELADNRVGAALGDVQLNSELA